MFESTEPSAPESDDSKSNPWLSEQVLTAIVGVSTAALGNDIVGELTHRQLRMPDQEVAFKRVGDDALSLRACFPSNGAITDDRSMV